MGFQDMRRLCGILGFNGINNLGVIVDQFLAATEQMGMGDLRHLSTAVGPNISGRQRERVRRHIEDAISKGAEVLAGTAVITARAKAPTQPSSTPTSATRAASRPLRGKRLGRRKRFCGTARTG